MSYKSTIIGSLSSVDDLVSELNHFISPICKFCHSYNHLEE